MVSELVPFFHCCWSLCALSVLSMVPHTPVIVTGLGQWFALLVGLGLSRVLLDPVSFSLSLPFSLSLSFFRSFPSSSALLLFVVSISLNLLGLHIWFLAVTCAINPAQRSLHFWYHCSLGSSRAWRRHHDRIQAAPRATRRKSSASQQERQAHVDGGTRSATSLP